VWGWAGGWLFGPARLPPLLPWAGDELRGGGLLRIAAPDGEPFERGGGDVIRGAGALKRGVDADELPPPEDRIRGAGALFIFGAVNVCGGVERVTGGGGGRGIGGRPPFTPRALPRRPARPGP